MLEALEQKMQNFDNLPYRRIWYGIRLLKITYLRRSDTEKMYVVS